MSELNEQRLRTLGWALALASIAAWTLLASHSAEAQEAQIPHFVLAQALGADHVSAAPQVPEPQPAAPTVNLVSLKMQQKFEDQVVAGVMQPAIELEVHFDFDSDELHSESLPQIEAAADLLNSRITTGRFRVAGYADPSGSADYNRVLSERRADKVWRVLVEEHGVDAARLERVGFGESDPDSAASDDQRRRVELQMMRADS